MAEPTVWGFTAVANTSKSFPLEGANVYGVDISGALTPKKITLGAGVTVLVTTTITEAALVELMKTYIQRYGAGHDGAGGYPTQAAIQNAAPLTTTT